MTAESDRVLKIDFLRGRLWDDILMDVTAGEWWSKHGPPERTGSGRMR